MAIFRVDSNRSCCSDFHSGLDGLGWAGLGSAIVLGFGFVIGSR